MCIVRLVPVYSVRRATCTVYTARRTTIGVAECTTMYIGSRTSVDIVRHATVYIC